MKRYSIRATQALYTLTLRGCRHRRIVGREKCFEFSQSRPWRWWACSPRQPSPPRRELTPAPGDIGLHTRRTLRLRTGRTRAGIWVGAIIIVGTTAIAKDISAAPTGTRQARESHRVLLTLNGRGEPRARCSVACYAAHMSIGSRRDAGVTKAAPVVQRPQRRIACRALR